MSNKNQQERQVNQDRERLQADVNKAVPEIQVILDKYQLAMSAALQYQDAGIIPTLTWVRKEPVAPTSSIIT